VQLILVLSSVEAMAEPNSPNDVKVGTCAGHEMPVIEVSHSQNIDKCSIAGKGVENKRTTSHGLRV
jgi:hypothetical protein